MSCDELITKRWNYESKIPPHNEISPPHERCMYVDSEDEDQIIEALRYISVNLNKIKGSRSLSREYSIKNFSVNNMLNTYKEIYKSLWVAPLSNDLRWI